MQGFCVTTGGATTLLLQTHLGIPISTTHTITESITCRGGAHRRPFGRLRSPVDHTREPIVAVRIGVQRIVGVATTFPTCLCQESFRRC
jgi:phosphate/sulfate permease